MIFFGEMTIPPACLLTFRTIPSNFLAVSSNIFTSSSFSYSFFNFFSDDKACSIVIPGSNGINLDMRLVKLYG